MAISFEQGQTLGRGDLWIELTDSDGNPVNGFSVVYAIFFVDPQSGLEVLIGGETRIPSNPAIGEYYAALYIPTSAQIGCYRIRWKFKETSTSAEDGVVMEFGVTGVNQTSSDPYSNCVRGLVNKMRVLLGDNAPDRTYRFRPPEAEGKIGCNNQVMGYIWTDEELAEFLEISLWKWNMHPPNTDNYRTIDSICSAKPSWQAALLWGGLVNAAQMLAYRWTADEFDYSIGGISLNIDKSSKYMDLKRNAEEQWDKLTEAKARTSKYMRGLSQPRFGHGVRSAFGPYVGRGVLSPKSFV